MHKFNHTPAQQDALVAELQAIGQRLLTLSFPDPKTDDQVIRHHAFLSGKFAAVKEMLEDDYPELPTINPETSGE